MQSQYRASHLYASQAGLCWACSSRASTEHGRQGCDQAGTGLIGTIAALVLGLLIASAKSSYDTQSTQVRQMTANIIVLDNLLAQYGPDASATRNLLRRGIVLLADRMWRENSSDSAKAAPFAARSFEMDFSCCKCRCFAVICEVGGLGPHQVGVDFALARPSFCIFSPRAVCISVVMLLTHSPS